MRALGFVVLAALAGVLIGHGDASPMQKFAVCAVVWVGLLGWLVAPKLRAAHREVSRASADIDEDARIRHAADRLREVGL